ncbi:MAG: hypothetical protein OJF55_001172 [Rhodanobacteraceae bacterium]|jgi:hypothetical protein|nr:MAG: hypothetical protein OJF55_001172 [Rhodanobacteraceae bacterium]
MNTAARLAVAKCDGCDADTLRAYILAGLVLVPFPAGLKGPRKQRWNERAHCWASPADVPDAYSGNVGLAHAYAGTCALDIDNAAKATPALAACGIDLAALLAAPDAVHIRSGRPGRDKLLYRLPAGVALASINRSGAEGFKLRCAASNGRTVQDVLPPSIHPDTGQPYQWQGDWHKLPDIPADLLALWQRLSSKQVQSGGHSTVTRLPSARKRRTLPDAIPEGERNATLFGLARGLVQRGHDAQAVNDRLQRINAERCTPPLDAREVDGIATQAIGYGSDGFAMLPHKLLDARELNALPLASRWIIVTAFRRYDGTGAGVALTHADCREIPGCAHANDFMRYRALAVASGILECKRKGAMTRDGKTPNLYAIARRFLPSHQYRNGTNAHQYRTGTPYIDIQGKALLAPAVSLKGARRIETRTKRGNER